MLIKIKNIIYLFLLLLYFYISKFFQKKIKSDINFISPDFYYRKNDFKYNYWNNLISDDNRVKFYCYGNGISNFLSKKNSININYHISLNKLLSFIFLYFKKIFSENILNNHIEEKYFELILDNFTTNKNNIYVIASEFNSFEAACSKNKRNVFLYLHAGIRNDSRFRKFYTENKDSNFIFLVNFIKDVETLKIYFPNSVVIHVFDLRHDYKNLSYNINYSNLLFYGTIYKNIDKILIENLNKKLNFKYKFHPYFKQKQIKNNSYISIIPSNSFAIFEHIHKGIPFYLLISNLYPDNFLYIQTLTKFSKEFITNSNYNLYFISNSNCKILKNIFKLELNYSFWKNFNIIY